MISYYPPLLLPYLSWKKSKKPQAFFFASWEDALWHLIDSHKVKIDSTVLIPDFYCPDVINNMRAHNLRVILYPLDNSLQPHLPTFISLLKRLSPKLVVIFHPAGITSQLVVKPSWRKYLSSSCLILHDYVHRLSAPSLNELPTQNDLAINSLRKNVPLSGSFLYAKPKFLSSLKPPYLPHPFYLFGTFVLYFCYRLSLVVGHLLKNRLLIRLAHQKILKAHDNLVGNSKKGNLGSPISAFLFRFVNQQKIARVKSRQVAYYSEHLANLPKLTLLPITSPGLLHAYPLIVLGRARKLIERALAPLNVWPKFADSAWSQNRFVFFLPLGPHITVTDQKIIVSTIQKSLSVRP